MKKHLLYAALFVGALSSCSKDNDRVSAPKAENDDLQAIELGVSSGQNFTAATRGLGMVGGISDPEGGAIVENSWNSQTLWVLMRKSETINNVTKTDLGYEWETMADSYTLLDNQKLTAPESGESGQITCNETAHTPFYYFPVTGNYDFYGYHVDDAAGETPTVVPVAKVADEPKSDYEYVAFTIDGTQDLMAAKADFHSDVVNSDATEDEKAELAGIDDPISYSAFAARRNVQPTLVFNHLLTKLNFIAVNMNKPEGYPETEGTVGPGTDKSGNTPMAANGAVITVTGIEITNTKAEGQLTVSAAKGSAEYAGHINWSTTADDATLTVMDEDDVKTGHKTADSNPTDGADKDLDDLVAVDLTSYNVDYNIGAGLLLQPKATADAVYTGTIYFEQKLKTDKLGDGVADEDGTDDGYKTETVKQEIELNIKASDIINAVEGVTGFAAGYAYNVYIKVWGIQQIEIEAVLTPWEEGGNVTNTPEDDVFGPEDIAAEKQAALDLILANPTSEADYVALLNWGEKYFVSATQLATERAAYNLDGDTDVDAADWAAFRLQTKLAELATDEAGEIIVRAALKHSEKATVFGCDALIEYLNNKTITDGDKIAEYVPSASCAYGLVGSVYFTTQPASVNAAWQAIEAKKAELNAAYDKADALKALKTALGETALEAGAATKEGCSALLTYLESYDIMGSDEEDELMELYGAAYGYKSEGITVAGVNAILKALQTTPAEPENGDDEETTEPQA